MNNYFCIINSEDGLVIERVRNIDEFLKEAAEEEYQFLNAFPKGDWNQSEDRIDRNNPIYLDQIILLKGNIIVPKETKVVKEYRLEEE